MLGFAAVKLLSAGNRMELLAGRDLGISSSHYPDKNIKHRSLTSIALATALENEKLAWDVIDPGLCTMAEWRKKLEKYSESKIEPDVIGISTTYFTTAEWLNIYIAMCRKFFPHSKILVGGYMYGTSTENFLSLDADLFMVGEAEERLPRLVRAIITKTDFKHIKGIYYRDSDGELIFSGHPEALRISELKEPNWDLSNRIEPQLNPDSTPLTIGIESQRGCVFKCQFCTFRTLTAPNALSVEQTVAHVMSTSKYANGSLLSFTDATATFPSDRWKDIMRDLISAGGSPHPISAYARVNDLTEEVVSLMDKANVRGVFIGQESGSQEILSLMKKGTHVSKVKPAIKALAKSQISPLFGFIHGLPGETDETIEETRHMICSLNEDNKNSPVVYQFALSPFTPQDLASVTHDADLMKKQYISTVQAVEAVLETFIASTQVSHAPNMLGIGPHFSFKGLVPMTMTEYHRWTKKLQRGVAIFAENTFNNRPIDKTELNRIKNELILGLKSNTKLIRRPLKYCKHILYRWLYSILDKEMSAETVTEKAGLLTKVICSYVCLSGIRQFKFPKRKYSRVSSLDIKRLGDDLADHVVQLPKGRILERKAEIKKKQDVSSLGNTIPISITNN
jgi:anaerobic magnesium-protoporphyrin IX monomethyl ester cyclase